MTTKIKISSFKESVIKFLSLIDYNDESIVDIFKTLKEKGKISHTNEREYWHGNHSHEEKTFTLYRIEEPMIFYVLETVTEGNSDNSYRYIEREVFVPNHE